MTTKPRPDGDALPLAVRNDLAATAYELHLTGKSWSQVAELVGWRDIPNADQYTATMVRNYLQTAAVQIDREERQHILQMECDRLDRLQAIAWEKVEERDLKAIDTVLRIMGHRAKLLGLETVNVNQSVTATTVLIGGDKENYLRSTRQVIRGDVQEDEAS
jgi:hypothetical protein